MVNGETFIASCPEYRSMEQNAGEPGAGFLLCLICVLVVVTAGCSVMDTGTGLSEGICEKLSGLDRDHCYQTVARAQNNPALCAKIEGAGPKSKCYLYLGLCDQLGARATGDGAYTMFDCWQYRAISLGSVRVCEEYLAEYRSGNRNDLNPEGVSREICIRRVTEHCGHPGQSACYDKRNGILYCVNGTRISDRCEADS